MPKELDDRNLQRLSQHAQRELTKLTNQFVSSLGGLKMLEKFVDNPADVAVLKQTITQLQDSYLSMTMLRALVDEQAAAIRRLTEQQRTPDETYARGWADSLDDLLMRLANEDADLRRQVESVLDRESGAEL